MAVGLGLSVFLLFEGLCHLFGWGRPTDFDDPYIGFREVHPLFVADRELGEYHTAPSRRRFFADESFPLEKSPDTFRIFVLGGSTVQGRPYSLPTAFPKFLELALAAADDERRWEVVNAGGISYASYRLIPILEECLASYEPDLVIVCTGHNEFLEDRTYGGHRPTSAVLPWVADLRTVVLLRDALQGMAGGERRRAERPILEPDADAILDYRDGLAAYHRDDAWHADVADHFAFNLRRMAERCRTADVPLLFVKPPSNLRDTLPFKSEHPRDLAEEDRTRFRERLDAARALYAIEPEEASAHLREALLIDQGYADAWYELGEVYETLGAPIQARVAYLNARDHDVCPLRMTTPLESAMVRVAEREAVPLFDAFAFLEADCPDGILDSSQLVDHVHPSVEGHRRIANALAERLVERGLASPSPGWRTRAAEAQRAHLDGLEEIYFLRGQRTLDNVREWTKGKSDGPPVQERFPDRIVD